VFAPFAGGDEATTLAADRAAATLVEDDLARPGRPGVLNATCTRQFFDESPSGSCSPTSLDAALGLDAPDSVNVTVEEDGSIHHLDGIELRAGPAPPDSAGIVVAHRVVMLDGEESHLYVRTW